MYSEWEVEGFPEYQRPAATTRLESRPESGRGKDNLQPGTAHLGEVMPFAHLEIPGVRPSENLGQYFDGKLMNGKQGITSPVDFCLDGPDVQVEGFARLSQSIRKGIEGWELSGQSVFQRAI